MNYQLDCLLPLKALQRPQARPVHLVVRHKVGTLEWEAETAGTPGLGTTLTAAGTAWTRSRPPPWPVESARSRPPGRPAAR